MKTKISILFLLVQFIFAFSYAQTPDFTGKKVMINPGHGGHDSDDRGMTNGFWESEGNLTKGLWLRDLLEARGCEIVMSRVLNRTEDDLPLSQIAAMANENNVDLFISIHSNAGNQTSNFPLTIFNGKSETPAIPESKVWAQILWEQLITNKATHWTSTTPHYMGDLTLNPGWTNGYGVLYPLSVPGIISEGSFHDYQPEVDRLLNLDYRKQEAWNMLYAMINYFEIPGEEENGNITGIIRDSFLINETYTLLNSPDKYLPVNGAKVEIMETGEQYLVDNQNTGFFYFDSIPPGDYNLIYSATDYFTDTIPVNIIAHQHNYNNYWLRADKTMPPKLVNHHPGDGELIKCNDPLEFTFNMNMDSATFADAFSITPSINGSFQWDKDYLNVEFQPEIPYETNTEYSVLLDSTAEHQWGVRIGTRLSFKFNTDDRNRYHVQSSFPENNQSEISPYLQFRIMFDAPINNTSLINAASIISKEGEVIMTKGASIKTIDNIGHYYFYPSEDLNFDEEYTLQLLGSIKDEEDIPLVDTIKIEFTTLPEIGPQIILDELESTSDWSLNLAGSIGTDPSSFIYKWNKTERSGSASMLLRYLFADESSYCLLSPVSPVAINTSAKKLNLWVWGELSANTVSAIFDNDQEKEFGIIDFAGWNFLSIDIPEGAAELSHLKLSAKTGSILSGDIYFDALSQPNTTGIIPDKIDNSIVISPNPLIGETLRLSGMIGNESSYSIYSIEGKVLQTGIISKSNPEIHINEKVKRKALFLLNIIDNNNTNTQLILNK